MNKAWADLKRLFVPNLVVESIYDINFPQLKKNGIRALILDIDDTLIPREINDVYPSVFDWTVNRKEEEFRLCLASNSRHPLRVKYIGETLNLPAMHLSCKPLPFAFWKSMAILGSRPEETAMIGDQLFMDVVGANALNIFSIYIRHGKEEDFLPRRAMRWAEEWVYQKTRPLV